MPPTMRADDIPTGWIGCVPHMRPAPPDGVDVCVGVTGKHRQKTIIRQTATLATYIESKPMERIIARSLLDHLRDNELLSTEQHGFIPGRSTCTNLLEAFSRLDTHYAE